MLDENDIVVCLCDYKINGNSTYLKIGIVTKSKWNENDRTYTDNVNFDSFNADIPEKYLRKIAEY